MIHALDAIEIQKCCAKRTRPCLRPSIVFICLLFFFFSRPQPTVPLHQWLKQHLPTLCVCASSVVAGGTSSGVLQNSPPHVYCGTAVSAAIYVQS